MIREDLKDKTEGAHGKRKHYNHIFSWQAGDKAATDAAFAKADVTIKEFIVYPRVIRARSKPANASPRSTRSRAS